MLVNPSAVEKVGEGPWLYGTGSWMRPGLMLEKLFNPVSSLFSGPGSTDGMGNAVQDLGVTPWEAAAQDRRTEPPLSKDVMDWRTDGWTNRGVQNMGNESLSLSP